MFGKKANTVIAVSIAVFFITVGCATLNKINHDLMGPDRVLKKKIAVLPFKDLTGSKENMLGSTAKDLFRKTISEHCEAIIVENDKRDRHLEEMAKLNSGAIDPVKQNMVARALGLNAILSGTLQSLSIADPAAFLELEVHLYDVETNAVLLSESVKSRVNISDRDRTNPKVNQRSDPRLAEELLQGAAPRLSEKICTIMEKELWKGYIISFANSEVELSAGADAGLRKGDVFEVFKREQPIEGNDGEFYLMSGPKIGEIKIEKVFQHTAVAKIISGADFDKSNCVKLKPE